MCLTLCNPMDCGPLGSSVHGILQARILEWVVLLQGIFLTQELNLSPSLAGKFFTTEASGKQTVQDGSKYFPDSL